MWQFHLANSNLFCCFFSPTKWHKNKIYIFLSRRTLHWHFHSPPKFFYISAFSLEMTMCSTLSSFGWLENCMLWAESHSVWKGGEEKERVTDGAMERQTAQTFLPLYTRSRECVRTDKPHCNVSMFIWLWLSTSNQFFRMHFSLSLAHTRRI